MGESGKLTKRCCRNCIHYVLGYTNTKQTEQTYVCNEHVKRIYAADYQGVKGRIYHFSTRPLFVCEKFKSKYE